MKVNRVTQLSKTFRNIVLLAVGTAFCSVPVAFAEKTAAEKKLEQMLLDEKLGKQAALFVTQIQKPWAFVTPDWTSPTPEQFAAARKSCETYPKVENPKVIDSADPSLPPSDNIRGTHVYYKGAQGLQVLDIAANTINVFPDVSVGQTSKGTRVYRFESTNGPVNSLIGTIQTDKGAAIGMLQNNNLFLSCIQPDDTSTN